LSIVTLAFDEETPAVVSLIWLAMVPVVFLSFRSEWTQMYRALRAAIRPNDWTEETPRERDALP
jgi:hypothetical protein